MTKLCTAAFLIAFVLCLAAGAQEPAVSKAEMKPVSYGLVIDNSGSIRTLLDRVIAVVGNVVEANKSEDETFVLTFVDTSKIVMRQEFTNRKSELHDAIQNMFIEGGQTSILDAVKISAEYLGKNARSEGERQRALILVTDGDDGNSGAKIEDVLRTLKENNVRVFVVAIAEGKVVTKLIDRLTKETGGMKFTPKTVADLTTTADQISSAIRTK